MTASNRSQMRRAALATGLSIALALSAAPGVVVAQEKATLSTTESATAKVTIKSIDKQNRRLVVADETGETFSLKAPPEARNFDNLAPGDTIAATYTVETDFVLAAENTPLPKDSATTLTARAAKGARPGGVIANQIVVTGSIVAIDMANNTLKLVSPQGGEAHRILVKSDEGRQAMAKMKVGDTITAYVTESLLLSVDPS